MTTKSKAKRWTMGTILVSALLLAVLPGVAAARSSLDLAASPPDRIDALIGAADAGPTSSLGAHSYVPCGRLVGHDVVCGDPVPIGTPLPLDLDRDPLTGVGGAEIVVHATPSVDPLGPLGFSLSFAATRSDTVPGPLAPLPAAAFIRSRVDDTPLVLTYGFDGTTGSLAAEQMMTATVGDVIGFLDGEMRAGVSATHVAGADSATIFVAADRDLGADDTARLAQAELTFSPVPIRVGAEIGFPLDESGRDQGDVEIEMNSTSPSTATLRAERFVDDRPVIEASLSITDLPPTAMLRFEQDPIRLRYDAAAPVASLLAEVDVPARGVSAGWSAEGVPRSFEVELESDGGAGNFGAVLNARADDGLDAMRAHLDVAGRIAEVALTDLAGEVSAGFDVVEGAGATAFATSSPGPADLFFGVGRILGTPTSYVSLADLPDEVRLSVDRGEAALPDVTATASAPGLDGVLHIAPDLLEGKATWHRHLEVTDLGTSIRSERTGKQVTVHSTPPTGRLRYESRTGVRTGPMGSSSSKKHGDLTVDVDATASLAIAAGTVTVDATNVAVIAVEPGLATSVEGTFDSLDFDLDAPSLSYDIGVSSSLTATLGATSIDRSLIDVRRSTSTPKAINWQRYRESATAPFGDSGSVTRRVKTGKRCTAWKFGVCTKWEPTYTIVTVCRWEFAARFWPAPAGTPTPTIRLGSRSIGDGLVWFVPTAAGESAAVTQAAAAVGVPGGGLREVSLDHTCGGPSSSYIPRVDF